MAPPAFSLSDGGSLPFTDLVPGSYTVDELALAGWDLTNIAISGDSDGGSTTTATGATIDLDPGENITVTFSNRKRGSITVLKETDPAGDPAVFSFASPGLAPPAFSLSDGGSLPFTDLVPGSYTVDELALAGWDLTNIAISGDSNGGSTTTATGATIDLDAGENIVVTFSNRKRGSITVVKITDPAGDPVVFNFTSPVLAAFTLSDGGSQPFTDLVAGSYTIDESALAGWDLTNVAISGDSDGGSATTASGAIVDLDPGENITVTFSNRKRGSITVVKITDPAGDPAVFNFTSPVLAAFTLSDGGSQPFTDLVAGSYTIDEAALAGWDLTNVAISGDSDGGSATTASGAIVDLDPGENITVTFSNRKRGSITVIKETDPAGDPAVFNFASPGLAPSAFTLSDGGSQPFTDLVAGSYAIDEAALAGWDLANITISGDSDGGSVTTASGATVDLDPGENIVVTFSNRKRGSITVIKETDPAGDPAVFSFASPGLAPPAFTLSDGGSLPFTELVPGSYPIDEAALAGWNLTNVAISGDTDGGSTTTATGATIDLDPGETITVTFSNRKRGSITVIKETDPAGDPAVFNFASPGLAPPAFTLSEGGSQPFTDLVAGSYTIDEAALAGWDLTNVTISGDTDGGSTTTATGALVDLDPGETITVTFSNRKRGSITVIKETDPAGDPAVFNFASPGLAPPAFTLSDGGSQPFTDLVAGSYTIDEAGLAGWDLTNVTISGDTDGGSTTTATGALVDLDPCENITVTFSNRKRGSITVIKETDPAGDPAIFNFASPGLAPPAFPLSDGGSQPFTDLVPGSYPIDETVLAGWDLANVTISGDTDGGSTTTATGTIVDLDPGENITVTFSNRKRGSITVIKETDPAGDPAVFSFASPGLAPPSFTLSDGGSLPFTDLVPGSYAIDELALAGWDLTNVTISGDTDGGSTTTATGATVDLDPGENITVTFSNRKRGSITVIKETDPAGDPAIFNFTSPGLAPPAFPLSDGGSLPFTDLVPGSYTVDELALAGWDLTNVAISGDTDGGSTTTATGATVDLDPGETITVTFSNRKRGSITVIKETDPAGDSGYSALPPQAWPPPPSLSVTEAACPSPIWYRAATPSTRPSWRAGI